jgi:hypothetical protein
MHLAFSKKTFHELQGKIELHLFLIPNLVCYCLLHNLLIGCHEINVKQILNLLQEDSLVQDYKCNHQAKNHE